MVAPMLDNALAPALDSGACPHLAVLLRNDAEFAPVVASFYLLGAKRGGLLAHRAAEVEADRQALAEAGLDVAGLESEKQLVIERLDLNEPPDVLPQRLEAAFDEAIGRGFTMLWSSHSPVGPEPEAYERAMTIERAWEARFGGRPVVTLCPYVVEGLEGSVTLGRFTGLAEHHDGVLVPSKERLELFKPA
jgi:MEDS: MEthanogen/methylotroph, DcmR Sensory domain